MKLINGYTKETFIAKVKEKNNGDKAIDPEGGSCQNKTKEGNHCFIGAFIPDNHVALESHKGFGIDCLLRDFPDLSNHMPFGKLEDLHTFQSYHDNAYLYQTYEALYKFVEKHLM